MSANKYMCHGLVLYRLITEKPVKIYQDVDTQAYIINDCIAILIKYSTKRLSPWTFTLSQDFDGVVDKLSDEYEVFVAFVCNDDGVACVAYDDYSYITSFGSYDTNSIAVRRKKGESYTVKGPEHELDHKVKDCDLPKRVLNFL